MTKRGRRASGAATRRSPTRAPVRRGRSRGEDFDSTDTAGFAEVEEGRLYFEARGRGHPLVLIHGRFMDGRMWDGQIEPFARHFLVVRYDARGHGQSSQPGAPYSPCADLRALLAHLGIGVAHLVGLSMGGGIAIDFTLTLPGMVSAIVVAEPGLGGYPVSSETIAMLDLVFDTAAREGRTRAIEVFLEQPILATAGGRPDALHAIRAMLEDNFQNDPTAMQLEQMIDPPAAGRLAEIKIPSLALVGELSGADARGVFNRLAAGIRKVRTAVIPAAGHMINLEQPAAFNDAVLGFLRPL